MDNDPVRRQVLEYLAAHHVLTLATQGPLGLWAAAVFYVNEGFDLFFLSAGSTRHSQNIGANNHVAATIQADYKDWPAIQGVQLEGDVVELQGVTRISAIKRYTGKYPFLAQPLPPVKAALEKINWYRLRPSLFYFIDNSKGFGYRTQIQLPGD